MRKKGVTSPISIKIGALVAMPRASGQCFIVRCMSTASNSREKQFTNKTRNRSLSNIGRASETALFAVLP